jgi:hypothetical protein
MAYVSPIERRKNGAQAIIEDKSGYVAPLTRRVKAQTSAKGDRKESLLEQRMHTESPSPSINSVDTVSKSKPINPFKTPQIVKQRSLIADEEWYKKRPLLDKLAHNPVANAITKASKFNDVQGAEMRKFAFGDVNYEATGNVKPTTGNKTADAIAGTIGMVSSAFLPSGGGAPAMAAPVRGAAELAANSLIPKVGNVVGKVGNVAARGALESLPYTAQQVFVGDKNQSATDILKTTGSNLALGAAGELGAEAVGALIRTISGKLKAGKALTPAEVETVKKTPELLALPEAKQYLMLEAPKVRTPDVIEGMPPKPTAAELNSLNKPVKTLPKAKVISEKKADFYANPYGVADTKPVNQLQLPAPKTQPVSTPIDSKPIDTPLTDNVAQKGAQSVEVSKPVSTIKMDEPNVPKGTPKTDHVQTLNYEVGNEVAFNLDNPNRPDQPFNADYGIISKIEDGKVYIKHYGEASYGKSGITEKAIPIKEFEKGIKNRDEIMSKDYMGNKPPQFKSINEQNIPTKETVAKSATVEPTKALPTEPFTPPTTRQIERPFAVTKGEFKKSQLPKNIVKKSDLIPKEPVMKSQSDWANLLPRIDADDLKAKQAARDKVRIYNEATNNVKYNVPEQYRKETPMTVSRSTIPPKVEGRFAKESFGEQGINKIPRAEVVTPTARTLPKPVNKVVMDSTKDKFSFKKAWDKFYNSTVDSQSGIAKLSKLAKDDTATLASNSRNAGGTVDYILKDALVDRQGNKIGKSLREVAEQIPKGKEEDFWNYMSQRHNIDRAREGKNVIPNYTSEMSAQAVKEIEALNPAYKTVGDDVTNWIDSFMREWGVNAGTVDADVYKGLRETYKSYFPTQREFSQLEKSMPDSVRKQFVDNASPIKKATGSDRDINNPLENIMNMVNRNVKTARYNQVGQSMLETVRKAPDKLKELAEIIPTKEGMFANTDNIISVLENGKPVYLRINNKELLEGLKGLPKVVNNAKAMRTFTNAFKGLITQKNPLFAVRNIFRDIPTAYIYGSAKNPVKFGADLAKAGKDILTNSENYQRYRAVGGGGSNFFKGNDVAESAKNLTKKNFNPISGIEKINNITETAPRLAEFNRIFEKTGDVQKALDAANNVTVNFARGGNATKAAEPFIPYLNAGVQGLDRFFKAFKDPKTAAATLLKGGIAITAPEIALYMLNKDNPSYQALDNRTKDTYFLIPKEDGTFWKIPKSRELSVLFGSLFQRIMRANDGDKEAFKGFGGTVATGFSPTNPLENNIFRGYFDLKSNKDFAGRAIVPQGMVMDNRSPYLQYDERTTEIAKAIGSYSTKLVDSGLSPKQIDFLIKSYTGVIGQLGMPLATKGASPTKAITTQFTSDPLYSNQALQDFYENYDKLQRNATDKNIVEKLPTNGKKNIVTKEEALRNKFSKASTEISNLNKEIKAIEASSAADKETRIRALRQRILDIAIETNKLK